MEKNQNELTFRVSTGLKNIIGRDLISDKYIAIFELVKNSYDAGAKKVNVTFEHNDAGFYQIVISDDGSGMSYDDIDKKWLFVAYSEKKPQNHMRKSYRDEIKREAAGAKGVGRFSCDRLGASLTMISKTISDTVANRIDVDWNKFEIDDSQEFIEVPVLYSTEHSLPSSFNNGTTLIVGDLRETWSREDLLKLKRSLMKLISPDADMGELPFDIELIVPYERENDSKILKKPEINPDRDIVNGIIHNDIFEKLNIKTTCIEVSISQDGKEISSKLTDRGEYIFHIIEKNRDYPFLKDINIVVYYLNRSAKLNFTRQMGGVTPKDYGSIFIYKNGFRINPYGEPGEDFFNIDQRKAQGWRRFLGTRELMGRISIKGENDQFSETTSRAHGFIKTPAVEMLEKLFLDRVIKVLEKYVVNMINWGEPLKSAPDHTIMPNEIGEQVITQLMSKPNPNDIISIDYNKDILTGHQQELDQDTIAGAIKKLGSIAEQTKNANLVDLAQSLKKRTEYLANENQQLEAENATQAYDLEKAKRENEARQRQVYFLQGTKNQNVTNLINGFHSVYTLTDATKGYIEFLKNQLLSVEIENKDFIFSILGQIYQSNEKAHKISELAINGNQSLKLSGDNSIYDYITQYLSTDFVNKSISIDIQEGAEPYNCRFDTASVAVIIDNIVSNSIKAGATFLRVEFNEVGKFVEIDFIDNGIGIETFISPEKGTDIESLFEWGFSSNSSKKGFGIGLYHIKQLVTEMKGTVGVDDSYQDGFKLVVKLRK